jgi:hypothetical protein
MKVQIQILYNHSEEKSYFVVSEIFEWNLPLPLDGEKICFWDESIIKFEKTTNENKAVFFGNHWEYKRKMFVFDKNESFIILLFGDL